MLLHCCVGVIACVGECRSESDSPPLHLRRVVRRPVAIVAGGKHEILIANRDTGTISVVDARPESRFDTALAEYALSDRLDDLVASRRDAGTYYAVDSQRHEVLSFLWSGQGPRSTKRRVVSRHPVSLAVSPDGAVVAVASLWSRRVTLLNASLEDPDVIDLPFAPLKQSFIGSHHLLVADAFGGRLAVIDVRSRRVQSHLVLNGQNIRGMAVSDATADEAEVILTHQILNVASSTTRSIISWGGVISNTLHTLSTRELLDSKSTDPDQPDRIHGRLFPLGDQGRGAGDPGDVIAWKSSVYVALTGVDEVGLRHDAEQTLHRQAVSRRPTRLLASEHGLFAVCTSDSAINNLDPVDLKLLKTIQLGPSVPRSLEQQGEELFFNARLSLDGWFSCHSCHSDGHSIGRLNDNLGDETFSTPKRILSLMGAGATEPWAWNGSQIDLRNQISKSIASTMAGPGKGAPPITRSAVDAIASYISSLPPAPGILTARGQAGRPGIQRGRTVFVKHGCGDCHQPPNYTSPLSHNVGLKDEWGLRFFNPPSLLGVSQRSAYFHDNRSRRLIDVLLDHDHDGAASLAEQDIDDLVLFLKSL